MREEARTRRNRLFYPLLRGGALLLALWALFVLALTVTALIPRSAIQESMSDAAGFYETADMFQLFDENDSVSVIHNYADAVLLNILWCQDGEHPLTAALDGAFYQDETQTQGQNLADAVSGAAANTSYARYWHGMVILLKPLLTVLSLTGVKILGAVVLGLLALGCLALLVRRRLYAAAGSLTAGLALVQVWLVPMCVEYYACFALMLVFAGVVLLRGDKLRHDGLLFACAGALTCFFDFLTCEILTLCLPLLCLLLTRREAPKPALRRAALCCAAWLAAYALSWACKWGLSAGVLGRSLTDVALGQGAYRAAGEIDLAGVDIGFQPLAAICVNLYCLFPFKYLHGSTAVWTVFGLVCLALFSVWFLYRRPFAETGSALAVLAVGLIPFVRYFCISNHAALHPFMTYRDLLASIVAVSCALALSVHFRRGKKATAKKGARS